MSKNYMKLNTIDLHSNYADSKSTKIQRLKKKISNSHSQTPFAGDKYDQPTDIQQAKLKISLIGLWHLAELNGQDKKSEKVFYNINRSQIKLLPYGEYKKYKNYNYILRDNHIYFGSGPFEINIADNEIKLNALDFNCQITFRKVTVEKIQAILSSKASSSGTPSHDLRFFDDYSIKDIMIRYKWVTYSYMYGNDSISYDQKKAEYTFNQDLSFCKKSDSGSQYGTFDVKKRELILTYNDGFEDRHKTIFVEYNKQLKHYYLYVSEECDRYEGCYNVYASQQIQD